MLFLISAMFDPSIQMFKQIAIRRYVNDIDGRGNFSTSFENTSIKIAFVS